MTTAEERFALGVRYIEAGTRLMDRLQAELEAEGVWDDAVRRFHAEWEEELRGRWLDHEREQDERVLEARVDFE